MKGLPEAIACCWRSRTEETDSPVSTPEVINPARLLRPAVPFSSDIPKLSKSTNELRVMELASTHFRLASKSPVEAILI
ncbi:MAG: hypothetical protein V7K88_20200 [Nostoc sp.]|uniref:hypothetical protein n=1 Tax=Nostoc sp. TaxID=1180 RepID=UPI002FF47761